MKKILLVLCFTVAFYNTRAQKNMWAGKLTYTKENSGIPLYLNHFSGDKNGNLYITGMLMDTVDFDFSVNQKSLKLQGQYDMFLGKYDNNGNLLWMNQINSRYGTSGVWVDSDKNGKVYTLGFFNDSTDIDPSDQNEFVLPSSRWKNNYNDLFFATYTSDGKFIDGKKLITSGGGLGDLHALLDANLNLYITGSFETYGNAVDFDPSQGNNTNISATYSNNFFLAKYNSSGNFQWVKTISRTQETNLNSRYIESISLDKKGNVYMSGSFYGSLDFDPGAATQILSSPAPDKRAFFISKYSSDGNYQWTKTIESNSFSNSNLVFDKENNFYIVGSVSGTTDFDPSAAVKTEILGTKSAGYVAKYSENFDLKWYKLFKSPTTGSTGPGKLTFNNDSTVLNFTGSTYGTIDYDPSSDNFLVESKGNADILLASCSVNGDFLGATAIGGIYSDQGSYIFQDPAGMIYIAGEYSDVADFNPFFEPVKLTSEYMSVFISKYNPVGISVASNTITSCEDRTLTINATGHGDATATYEWFKDGISLGVNSSDATLILANATLNDAGSYKCRMKGICGEDTSEEIVVNITAAKACTTGVDIKHSADNILTFPNPASDELFIKSEGTDWNGYSWKIFDIFGRQVDSGKFKISSDLYKISTESCSEGIYTLQIDNGNAVVLMKKISVVK
jgi:hypothetical protein